MIELHIRPLDEDRDGWVEVCLVTQPMVGYIRVAEGTEDGPVTWWDARAFLPDGKVEVRRFMSQEGALLALALRAHLPVEAQRSWGW
jgi:hypothetical protein